MAPKDRSNQSRVCALVTVLPEGRERGKAQHQALGALPLSSDSSNHGLGSSALRPPEHTEAAQTVRGLRQTSPGS